MRNLIKVKFRGGLLNEVITSDPKEKSLLGKLGGGVKKLILGKNIYKFYDKIKSVATFNDYTLKPSGSGVLGGANQFTIKIFKGKEPVGEFVAFVAEDEAKRVSLQIQKVEIFDKYKGKGIMKNFYQEFNQWLKDNFEEFGSFNSDFTFLYNEKTGGYDGFNMWEKLVKMGKAKRMGPDSDYIPPAKPEKGKFWFLKSGYSLL